ncbi:phBC6A51 family helix-turn-helix protein [Bacillus paramycoides]|uniref:phBC6A51 family helix-turn-helix protein n=1 Tax=Bacillus paramycoides TaxID=2026194 RepID=UPI003CFF5E66
MSKKRRLTQQQRDYVEEAFYKKRNGESYTSIAKSFGISRRTLFAYRNSEEGQQIERELNQNLIDRAYHSIMQTVINKAEMGSFQHAKLYMQITGKMKEQEGVQVNVSNNIKQEGVSDDLLADIDAILQEECKYGN